MVVFDDVCFVVYVIVSCVVNVCMLRRMAMLTGMNLNQKSNQIKLKTRVPLALR